MNEAELYTKDSNENMTVRNSIEFNEIEQEDTIDKNLQDWDQDINGFASYDVENLDETESDNEIRKEIAEISDFDETISNIYKTGNWKI